MTLLFAEWWETNQMTQGHHGGYNTRWLVWARLDLHVITLLVWVGGRRCFCFRDWGKNVYRTVLVIQTCLLEVLWLEALRQLAVVTLSFIQFPASSQHCRMQRSPEPHIEGGGIGKNKLQLMMMEAKSGKRMGKDTTLFKIFLERQSACSHVD